MHLFAMTREVTGSPPRGQAFLYLPMPLRTGLPVHLQACFATKDNRRDLCLPSEDLQGRSRQEGAWNDVLIRHVLPPLYAEALGEMVRSKPLCAAHCGHYEWYYDAWPDLEVVKAPWRHALVPPCSPCLLDKRCCRTRLE